MSASAGKSPDWDRLELLVKRLSGARRVREPREIREFWRLYRAATSRLAALQSSASAGDEEWYLNRLVAAAHGVLYRKTSERSAFARFFRFVARGWPEHVRRNAGLVGLATALFLVGALLGVWYAATDDGFVGLVTPPSILAAIERGEMWTDDIREMKPVFTSLIFSNNLMVGILAFAFGISAGIGTAWILFANGVLFGGISWVVLTNGMARPFWGFVVAHGALEFPAIFLAGAAGFAIARGMLFPGSLPRSRAIAAGGMCALKLLSGTVILFLVAAGVESWFSPEPYALSLKITVAAVLLLGLLAWLARPGPHEERA